MPIPTRSDLRAAFANALAQQADPTDPAAAIRAAVDVVLPGSWLERLSLGLCLHIRHEFLALADAIQGDGRNG